MSTWWCMLRWCSILPCSFSDQISRYTSIFENTSKLGTPCWVDGWFISYHIGHQVSETAVVNSFTSDNNLSARVPLETWCSGHKCGQTPHNLIVPIKSIDCTLQHIR